MPINFGGIVRKALGGVDVQGVNSEPIPFRSNVTVEDGDAAYDTEAEVFALITNTAYTYFKKIWEKTVPAQQLIHWGYGSPALPYNQGYMWFAAVDSGTGFAVGVLRIEQANARETKIFTVAEIPDKQLHTVTSTTLASATPTLGAGLGGMALPEKVEFPWIGEDSRLQLWYKLVTATTAIDASNFNIPISVRQ